jgi:RNA-splicing ligase RtcB
MRNYNLRDLSDHQMELRTDTAKVPAILFTHRKSLPNSETLEKIEKVIGAGGVFHHIAALSEAHSKPGIKNPTGVVVASEENIFPEALDAAPNCGMRVVLSDLSEKDLSPDKVSELFSQLKSDIPSKKLSGFRVSPEMVMEIFQNGSSALRKIFSPRTKNEFANTFENGNFFRKENAVSLEEISASLPKAIIKLGEHRLGLLGATSSHFLHLAKVSSIENLELAAALNLKEGQYLFFLHTGSSIVGRYAASLYTPRKIKSFSQKVILFLIKITASSALKNIFSAFKNYKDYLFPYRAQSQSGKKLITALRATGNYGFANRTVITHQLDLALEKIFGRPISLELLYDSPHVYVDQEEHLEKRVWVHRNGANRAFGPQKMNGHEAFAKTGEPVLIAPFGSTGGYIGVGTDENELSFSSANHELGAIKELALAGKAAAAYSQESIEAMEKNKLIKLVAKIEVLKTLTY